MNIITTERLILRTWQDTDAQAYYDINQDPKVIELLRGTLTMQEVQDFMSAQNKQFADKGYMLWAAEEKISGKLMGFVGLNYTNWEAPFYTDKPAPFTPAVEIGWRLASAYWGKGYATEGAIAALNYGFDTVGLQEIVSFTVPANVKSLRVMEKIGMDRDLNGDFLHPKLPLEHKLSQHILYRIKR